MPKKPEIRYVTPTLESITIKGKYIIEQTDFNSVKKMIRQALEPASWVSVGEIGESLILVNVRKGIFLLSKESDVDKEWTKDMQKTRSGVPIYVSITTLEHLSAGILVEVECRPNMWYRISQLHAMHFQENQVQEALLECKNFVKRVMSIFSVREIEPVSVYPIIPRTEIKSRLLNLGLREITEKIDKAEEHIVQNNFSESLKSSRTAFEKMIDWQMKKRGLEKTDNYRNGLVGYSDSSSFASLLRKVNRNNTSLKVHINPSQSPYFTRSSSSLFYDSSEDTQFSW
jgi:hypothetical protein